MFIGLGSTTSGNQTLTGAKTGGNQYIVSTSNNGNYSASIQAGDFIIVFASNNIPISMPEAFTVIASGNLSNVYYSIAGKVADGDETGLIGVTASSIGSFVTRNQSYSNIVIAANNGTSWSSLSGLSTNNLIVAAGYSDDGTGLHGGQTIPSGFTTYESTNTVIIAVQDVLNSSTSFAFDGFVNGGSIHMCYSIGIG